LLQRSRHRRDRSCGLTSAGKGEVIPQPRVTQQCPTSMSSGTDSIPKPRGGCGPCRRSNRTVLRGPDRDDAPECLNGNGRDPQKIPFSNNG
jgi:hypothetical protein